MYKLVEREALIDLVRVKIAEFQGFYGFLCFLGVGETADCHVLGRAVREVEMVRKFFRSFFFPFFFTTSRKVWWHFGLKDKVCIFASVCI